MKNKRTLRARRPKIDSLLMQAFNLKRLLLLFLSGFALGVFMISMGWAATTSPTHKGKHQPKHKISAHPAKHAKAHKTVAHHAKAHKSAYTMEHRPKIHSLASRRMIHDAPPSQGKLYKNPEGLYKFRYPSGWEATSNERAMLVKSPGQIGVFGIVQRPDDQPNAEAVRKEYKAPNRPADMKVTRARVAGITATKVIRSKQDDPYTKTVEYYLQHPNGHQYYILMMAPHREWARYSKSFGTMLKTLSFH